MERKFIVYGLSLIVIIFTIYDIRFTIYASEATPSAQVADIGIARIHPASPLYFLKAIRENLEMKLAQTQRVKNFRQLEFATRRLRETKALIATNQDLIPPTLERYVAHLNNLTDKHQKNDPFADDLKNNLSIHLTVLQRSYDQSSSLRAKMFIRSAMNRVIQRADVSPLSKMSVCEFFAKVASSSSLNKVEQAVYKSRAQSCLNSLKVVPGF